MYCIMQFFRIEDAYVALSQRKIFYRELMRLSWHYTLHPVVLSLHTLCQAPAMTPVLNRGVVERFLRAEQLCGVRLPWRATGVLVDIRGLS